MFLFSFVFFFIFSFFSSLTTLRPVIVQLKCTCMESGECGVKSEIRLKSRRVIGSISGRGDISA